MAGGKTISFICFEGNRTIFKMYGYSGNFYNFTARFSAYNQFYLETVEIDPDKLPLVSGNVIKTEYFYA
jgi:hypothetical protein